eukprot:gene3552-4055_t
MADGGKNKLEVSKADTKKYLKDFKAKVGYKEGLTVETEKQRLSKQRCDDDDYDTERDDEQPAICVLKK